ncbi:hypothetical protein BC829DRAFT_403759 [Chytridium lagenaria]|nr:hypothetical protein BC829DRAFT_403759 [Chytridium lagenaria]
MHIFIMRLLVHFVIQCRIITVDDGRHSPLLPPSISRLDRIHLQVPPHKILHLHRSLTFLLISAALNLCDGVLTLLFFLDGGVLLLEILATKTFLDSVWCATCLVEEVVFVVVVIGVIDGTAWLLEKNVGTWVDDAKHLFAWIRIIRAVEKGRYAKSCS